MEHIGGKLLPILIEENKNIIKRKTKNNQTQLYNTALISSSITPILYFKNNEEKEYVPHAL